MDGVGVDQTKHVSRATAAILAVLAAIATAVVMYLWRFPSSGVDTDPPVCGNAFGNVVPCGSEQTALALIAVGAFAVGALTYVGVRRLPSRRLHVELRAS